MTTLQLLSVGAFLMGYYYFVLRKYNTLGFRMFSLFFFAGVGVCYWWYVGYLDLKDIRKSGIATQALVLKKSSNSLEVRFADQSGKLVIRTQTGGVSVEELAAVQTGKLAPILYAPQSDTFYLTSSYQRQRNDTDYFLIFPGILFLIGIVCLITLRKYRVHPHEGTIFEYLTDERGNVIFGDARNSTTKGVRVYATVSKFFELFQR